MSAAPLEAPSATPRTEDLHDRYGAAVFAYCSRRLRSREDAEDATQIVFLNAYRRLAEGVVPQSDPAWLFAIARNVVLHRRRTLGRRARIEFPADLAGVPHAAAPAVSETAPELFGLADALAGLTESQRRAIVLREWAGPSYREIAAELALSISAVETLIFRARRSLAGRMVPGDRRRKRVLGVWLPGAVKSLLGGVAAKVTTGAASVAVIVAAGGPLASDRGPVAGASPSIHRGVAATLTSLPESSRPSAVTLRPATDGVSVPRRPEPATAAARTEPAGSTAATGEAGFPTAWPEPADSAAPPAPPTADPAPAPIPDVAPSLNGDDRKGLETPLSTPATRDPSTWPEPPAVPASSEGVGAPASLPAAPSVPAAAQAGNAAVPMRPDAAAGEGTP